MKEFTSEQVVKYMVKYRWDAQKAEEKVKNNYDLVRKSYPDARCAAVAKIIMYYC